MLSPYPRAVEHFHTSESIHHATSYVTQGQFDALIADEICMTPYVEAHHDIPRITIRHKVDHIHYREVASQYPWKMEKLALYLDAYKMARYERAKMPLYDGFLACSQDDATAILAEGSPSTYQVIPNGADLSRYVPRLSSAQPPILLYVGSMHYYPNIDAIRYFFDQIYRQVYQARPEIRVQIVGHHPPAEIQKLHDPPRIEVTGSVPDVIPYYDRATIFFVPLRLGGGTRLKIIEAMAMGLPVVSTRVGAEGLEIQDGENILLADDPSTFAQAILKLLDDPSLRQRLGKKGRALAQRYDWMTLTRPFADFVENVARTFRRS
jgi:glycosyltransferase involved in cell wall biosynthesis